MAVHYQDRAETSDTSVTPVSGLTGEEARRRLAEYGYNWLTPRQRPPSRLRVLLKPLADPMVALLIVAGATYAMLRDYADAAVVLLALVPITLVSFVLERRAERTLESLRKLTAPTAAVFRDGTRQVIPSEEIVPGDVAAMQEGDVIPADGELLTGLNVMVDESALTGESLPVSKSADLSDSRRLFAGTTVLSGRGLVEIQTTGQQTQYGRIGSLLGTIEQPPTPLQQLIGRLIRQLALGALVLCLVVATVEFVRSGRWSAAIIAGVSLAIAAVPEEFPMVYTLYLSLGAWRLARDRALVRRLPGVETLGSTTVICTDKTGTLTLGSLEVSAHATSDGAIQMDQESLTPLARRLVEAAVLASEPEPFDPLDQAILRFAASHGIDIDGLHQNHLAEDYPFEPGEKYVTHVWLNQGMAQVAAKGAIEGILRHVSIAEEERRAAEASNQSLAAQGLRVIAVAAGTTEGPSGDRARDERALRFLGLLAFSDPLRPGVREALAACRGAGVRVIMLTGDHPATAHAVAESLAMPHEDGMVSTGDEIDAADDERLEELARRVNIFARIRPEQKHRLVSALRRQHEIVAMTGDGINDAPALREADIGIAMGRRGTEVARSAATLVLLDDNFSTIVAAIKDGRRIFDNLRRAFTYLLAFHIPLLVPALVVPFTGEPLLFLPVHLVWLELIIHPTASLVFEGDVEADDVMTRPPRRQGSLISRNDFGRAVLAGLLLAGAVVALYLLRLSQDASAASARSSALTALIAGQVVLCLLELSHPLPLHRGAFRGNRALAPVVGAVLASLVAALFIPPVRDIMKLAPLAVTQLAVAVAIGVAATIWQEPFRRYRVRRRRKGGTAWAQP